MTAALHLYQSAQVLTLLRRSLGYIYVCNEVYFFSSVMQPLELQIITCELLLDGSDQDRNLSLLYEASQHSKMNDDTKEDE